MTNEQSGCGPSGAAHGRRLEMMVLAGLVVLGLALYGNALCNPFIIDDEFVILKDPRVEDGRFVDLITQDYWPPPARAYYYRPLVSLSFGLNWALSHEPWAFRAPNLALYIGTTFVLFLLTRGVTGSAWAGGAAAVLFSVHPLHTGPLNCIVDRAELCVGFFGLLGLWLVWRDLVTTPGRGAVRPVAAALCFAAAFFSKEHAITLVGAVILIEVFARRTGRVAAGRVTLLRSAVRYYVPLAVAVALYFAARAGALGNVVRASKALDPIDNIVAHPAQFMRPGDSPALARWGTPVAIVGLGSKLLAWPRPLSWDYAYAAIDIVHGADDLRLWVGGGVLALALGALVWGYRRRSAVFLAVGFAVGTYSIVSNTFVLIGTAFAERFLYLPSAGVCMLVGLAAAGAMRWLMARRERVARAAGGLFLGVLVAAGGWYGWLTTQRNLDYRAQPVLNAADLAKYPRSARLLASVALDALNTRKLQRAIDRAREAIAVAPDYSAPWQVAGLALYAQGSREEALAHLSGAIVRGAQDEAVVVTACELLVSNGNFRGAIGALDGYVRTSPSAADAQNALAWYLITAQPEELRDPRRALVHAQAALRRRPRVPEFIDTYVSVLVALRRPAEALAALEQALPRVPRSHPGRGKLESKLAELRAAAATRPHSANPP